jgi:hypothetical protein
MARPKTVYDPMTGKLDRKRSTAPMPVNDPGPHAFEVVEPVHVQLGISEHRLARVDGNVEKLSIRGTRIA